VISIKRLTSAHNKRKKRDRVQYHQLCLSLLVLAVSLTVLALAAFSSDLSSASPKVRLNLLLITIDTLRTDRVSFYSSKHLRTPHLDKLAAESVVFTRAFCHNPTTLPSHANMLLGTTACYHGVHDNANFIVRKEFLTLAELLKKQGYRTGAFVGGFPLESRFGLDQGFDVYDDDFSQGDAGLEKGRERRAQAVVDSAWKWLAAQKAPWFLWVHCFDPHDPYAPPEPFKTQFAANPYDGEVAYTDEVIGNFLGRLEKEGHLADTIIIFTGDHGESLGEHGEKTHGYLAYNTTLWIPLTIFAPGFKHRVISNNVGHIDIYPTVCELVNVNKPDFLQGRSLLPLMKGKKATEELIYFESLSPYYNMGWAPIRGFIYKQEKFMDSPIPEIFDLEKDFEEKNNLAGGKNLEAYRERLETLIGRQSSEESLKAEKKLDRETQERLRSLGYLASLSGSRKEMFGPGDDVKALLPYHNQSMEALDMFRAGRAREAVERLREVITARKNINTAYLNLAMIFKRQGRLSEAIAVLEAGLENLPENYDLFSQHLAFLYEASRFDEAIQSFEAGRFPQFEFDPVIWNYAGLAYSKKGEPQKARQCYEKSLAIDPKFAVPYNNLGTLDAFEFRRTSDQSLYQKSAENFERAIALDPGYSAAYHGLGVVRFQAGDYARAIPNLEKALEIDPGLDEALFFLGLANLEAGDKTKALSCFLKYKTTPSYELLSPPEKARLEEYIAKSKRN
jgi:arylsulfatase A-like enzyme/Tfp pilus assembly protein PilF